MKNVKTVRVKVWGDLACFTRPDIKVDRLSYPIMTPSAARGIIDSIIWRPSIFWAIRTITVLRPIRYTQFRRNEVTSKARPKSKPIVADDLRIQRNTQALKDVAYIIEAEPLLTPVSHADETTLKFIEMLERRVAKGQCFRRPAFGLREFAAHFGPDDGEPAYDITQDFGVMLHDIAYSKVDDVERFEPRFFQAKVDHGIMMAPDPSWVAVK